MTNPFLLDKTEYKRDIHPMGHYLKQAASYLSINTGKDYNECLQFVKDQIKPGGQFEFKDPQITYFYRENFEDRVEVQSGTLEYIHDALKNKEIIAPTLTTYVNPKEKESLLVSFIDTNVKTRNVAKKKMFAAGVDVSRYTKRLEKAKKENNEADIKKYSELVNISTTVKKIQNTIQTNSKISNNSLSGAHVSAGSPVSNKTAHSSLTSTCRITSSYGNCNNEKFLAGNRHYFSYETVLNNITSIVTNVDYNELEKVIEKYGIALPSVEQTFQCIKRSTDLYWNEEEKLEDIKNYLTKLNPLQRAAFVYVGDLYHLKEFNDSLVRGFVEKLSSKKTGIHPDPLSVLEGLTDEVSHLASQICDTEMKGSSIQDVFATKIDENDNDVLDSLGNKILLSPERANTLALTIENVQRTVLEYGDLIHALWTTKNFPSSVSKFPDSIRRVVLVSDTDSTIFTVQDWVEWYFGKIIFNEKSLGVCASIVFLVAQTIAHVLAMMSANLGVVEERLFQIVMKNEYRFDILVPTTIAKHYYALIGCREGRVYSEYEPEIKGVHLKSSNAPKSIMDAAHELMSKGIMEKVISGESISIEEVLRQVGDIERNIIKSVKAGNYEFLRLAQIKESESYVLDDSQSPYQHYTMWNEVFGPKYGMVAPPPYTAIKVSSLLNSKKRMVEWLDSLADQELADRMRIWLGKNDKKNGLGTFQLPDTILSAKGFPEEIFDALDIRRIVIDATGVFYHILETLGIYLLDKQRTKLVSDYY